MDYHGAKEEHILRYLTILQRDKRPEERQPLGTGIHVFVFFVASPFTYARYAQGLRLKHKHLYLPSNAQVIFNRALIRRQVLQPDVHGRCQTGFQLLHPCGDYVEYELRLRQQTHVTHHI